MGWPLPNLYTMFQAWEYSMGEVSFAVFQIARAGRFCGLSFAAFIYRFVDLVVCFFSMNPPGCMSYSSGVSRF